MKTISKALRVLKRFAGQPEWGVSELARDVGIDKVIVHRILKTCLAEGFLVQDAASRRYRLGAAAVDLATGHLGQMRPLEAAQPHMLRLWEETRETVHFVVRRGHQVVAMHVLESPQPVRVAAQLGEQAPIHCSSTGKVFLAFDEQEVVDNVLNGPLARITENTIIDPAVLAKELKNIRRRGYAIDDRELLSDARSAAAPILGMDGMPLACLAVIGPSARLSHANLRALLPKLQLAASNATRALGSRLSENRQNVKFSPP